MKGVGVYIGTPTYDGKYHWSTTAGLAQVARFTGKVGLPFAIDVVPGDAFIGKARDTLVERFLRLTDWEDLVFIDADVGFTIDGFKALMVSKVDICMGLYRTKEDRLKFPALLADPIVPNAEDPRLVKLQYGPAGFMRVKRRVFEKMMEKWPEDYYFLGEQKQHEFFPHGRNGHNFGGEDIRFCERAQECGFDVWAVQGIELDHTGPKTWDAKWQVLTEVKEAA